MQKINAVQEADLEKYTVEIVFLHDNSVQPLTIEADEAGTSDDIVLNTFIGGTCVSASGYGYFAAFQKLRDKLLRKGYGVKCIGAKLNAVQSSMAGSTPKIYLVELGKQALLKDLVCLFDYADISVFPDTKEQNKFTEKWVCSLGRGN